METIFENIGFKIKCEEDVYRLADYVLNSGKILPHDNGAYAYWEDKSGAQVWLRLAHEHDKKRSTLLNIDPHFRAGTVWEMRVREKLEGEQDDFLDGKYLLETLDGDQFIAARVMGSEVLANMKPGSVHNFQLAMIPHGIKFFESEAAYREYYKDEKTVLGAIFPRGVYSRRLGGDEIRREEILMTGLVCRVGYAELRHIHEASQDKRMGNFWQLTCETLMGPIDVVSAAEEENFEHQRKCMEGGEPVISVFGTIGALAVVRKDNEQDKGKE